MIEFCLACYLMAIPIQRFRKAELFHSPHEGVLFCESGCSSSLASMGHFSSLFLPC